MLKALKIKKNGGLKNMELLQVNTTKKELGLDKFNNPVKRNKKLGNCEKMVNFAVQTFRNGMKCEGIMYRANIFIFYNDGTYTMMYNDFKGINVAKDLDKNFVTGFAKRMVNTEDCIIIYECDDESFAVAA